MNEHIASHLPLISPVAPSDISRLALLPLSNDAVRIEGGFWADKLETNRAVSLICGHDELERAGNFSNFRVAAGLEQGSYRGTSAIGVNYMFLDSDIYKWLEAVYWELGRKPSPQLQKLADDAVRLLAAAQEPDGYLNSFFQITTPGRRWHMLVIGHELYNAGHLLQAGVAEARATGQTALLDIVRKNADCIYREFVDNKNPGLPAHPGVEMALVELYRVTDDRRYLALAQLFIGRRGEGRLGEGRYGPVYYEDHLPIRQAETITGHAVMALYLGSALVDAYVETGDSALLAAAERQWDDLVSSKMYITGGLGSRYRDESIGDAYELPADRAYCETCAAIGSVMLSWRLLLATGHGRYADLIERTLYNAMLPGVSLDGTTFFYANPLQVRTSHLDSPDGIGAAVRSPWFFCACCPPNVMRTLSSFEHLVATHTDAGIQLHQYVAGTQTAQVAGGAVRLRVATAYPWQGEVKVTVEQAPGAPFELSIRVPGWAAGASLAVNGESQPAKPDALGYVRLSRIWREGDRVTLVLPLVPHWVVADDRIDAVRGCIALERGPLVYCFEHNDQPHGVSLDEVAAAPGPIQEVALGGPLAGLVGLGITGGQRTDAASAWPYRIAGSASPQWSDTPMVAIPYFAWANRTRGAMRIWVPERR